MFLVFGIWSWRMPEKRWVNWLKADRNMLGIDYSKYNQKKIRSANTTLLLFEAVCLFLIGLTIGKHPVLTKALCVGIVGAPIGLKLFVWELWEHLLSIGLCSWCSARRVNTGRNRVLSHFGATLVHFLGPQKQDPPSECVQKGFVADPDQSLTRPVFCLQFLVCLLFHGFNN